MPTTIVPAPPAAPTITGDLQSTSVFLDNPTYVRRQLEDMLLNRFVTPYVFAAGPRATGGAVKYDQLTANDTYLDRDVQRIQPGAEFPLLTDSKPTPKVTPVDKYGGRIEIFKEDIIRSNFNVVQREFAKLRNTILRKVDTVALLQLSTSVNPALLTYAFSTTFAASTAAQLIDGLIAARLVSTNLGLGYSPQTLLLNPIQAARLKSIAVQNKWFGDGAQLGLITSPETEFVGNIFGMDIIATTAVTAGTGYLLDREMVGGISDETPLNVDSYYKPETESWFVQGSRTFTAYVTDPKAAILLTGL